jgi:D-alanyl-lipoteichoic acid acyltransferase DltB (MBOAT superfamily)
MLYFSPEYILAFLPLTICIYFLTQSALGASWAKVVLIVASLAFYGIWNASSVPILMTSILVNFAFAWALFTSTGLRKATLIAGLSFNIGLLAYFKYTNFLIANLDLFGWKIRAINVILPLGISFFTFQKIALLVDIYKGRVEKPTFLNLSLFVTFFPQLVAGPIVHHSEVMPQFDDKQRHQFNIVNFSNGLTLFILGFFKKLFLADYMAVYANSGFSSISGISTIDAWIAALSYSFQLYFDFSGFIDMGIGSALMLNIQLPQNFMSPYKARNIQEFWRRWHITLGRFLRDYIYIPLGGAKSRALTNLMVTFLIGGLWHGAAWTFVAWGALHGAGLCVHRIFQKTEIHIPKPVAVLLTFWFVVCGWVFFRAASIEDALTLLHSMHDPRLLGHAAIHPVDAILSSKLLMWPWATLAATCFIICWAFPNSHEIIRNYQPRLWHIPALSGAATIAFMFAVYVNAPPPFLYFNF